MNLIYTPNGRLLANNIIFMKLYTIKKRREFIKLQKEPSIKYSGKTTTILFRDTDEKYTINNQEQFVRIGIVATKKIDNRAVIRNKIKRRIREAIRKISKETCNLFINHSDYELIAKKDFLDYKYQEIVSDLKDILQRVKIKYEQHKFYK